MLVRIIKDPLLHFLALGALLFWLFYEVGDPGQDRPDRIIVTRADVDRLSEQWQRQWRRPPTQQELRGLVDSHVREMILYREALALGLDQDDVIVRRRLGQKLEFMFKDLAEQSEPSEEELAEFLENNRHRYIVPERYTFTHVYLNRDKRGTATEDDARELLQRLRKQGGNINAADVGDRFLYEYGFDDHSPMQISRLFGRQFADALLDLEPQKWHGPVESGYGLHLVFITDKTDRRDPPLSEVRNKVQWDLIAERSKEVDKAFYEELRKRYEVDIEPTEGATRKTPGNNQ